MTGFPWATGDALLAADLNAAIANSSSISGGPFLPLSGGTVTGSVHGRADQALGAGGAFQGYTVFSSAISGVRTGGDWQLSGIATTSDTLDAGSGGLVGQYIHLISGGTGTSGNRIGQYIDTYFSGSTLDGARGYPSQYGGQWVYAHASGNAGGTSLGASRGQLWGSIASATLQAGATFWAYCIGMEIDVGVSTGASAPFVQGLKIVAENHNQPSNANDFLLGMSKVALTDQQFANGIVFGTCDGYWPIASTGTLVGAQASLLATPPARTAAYGIDLNAITFSQAAYRSTNFLVDGTGHVSANGVDLSSRLASGVADFTKHLALYGTSHGISVTSDSSINYTTGGAHMFWAGATRIGYMNSAGVNIDGTLAVGSTITAGSFGSITSPGPITLQTVGISATDLTHGLQVYSGFGFNAYNGAVNAVANGSASVAFIAGGIAIPNSGPTIRAGAGVATGTQPNGSLWLRTDGTSGARLYVSAGSGTWAAVAGV